MFDHCFTKKHIICDRISSIICRVSDIYIIHIYIYTHKISFPYHPTTSHQNPAPPLKKPTFQKTHGDLFHPFKKGPWFGGESFGLCRRPGWLRGAPSKKSCRVVFFIAWDLFKIVVRDLWWFFELHLWKSAFMEVFFACFQRCGANLTACNFVIRL